MIKKQTKKKDLQFKVFTICPKCDASMEVRNGKYGEFYSCINFKCGYIPTKKEMKAKKTAMLKVSELISKKRSKIIR